MHATATVIEIDNRVTRRRWKLIVPTPQRILVHRLRQFLTEVDPDTGELLLLGRDPFTREPLDACVSIDRWGRIRVTIYPTRDLETAQPPIDRDCGWQMMERAEQIDPEHIREEIELIKNLAENIRRRMAQAGITIDTLAANAGVCPLELSRILDRSLEAAPIDVVLDLAEYFNTTVAALIAPPADMRREE